MEIRDLELFRELTDEEIRRSVVCSEAKVQEYEKNEYIFRQEDVPRKLYFILDGSVLLGQINVMGRQNYAEYLGEGQSFGEADLFLERASYEYFAQARMKTKVLSVSRHFFYSTCTKNCMHHSKIIYNMMKIFAEESDARAKKIYLLTCGTLRQRVTSYLMQLSGGNAEIELTMKREELAAYLNTTRPSLSRELSYLKDCKVIDIIDRSHIKILDFELLQYEIDKKEE